MHEQIEKPMSEQVHDGDGDVMDEEDKALLRNLCNVCLLFTNTLIYKSCFWSNQIYFYSRQWIMCSVFLPVFLSGFSTHNIQTVSNKRTYIDVLDV